MSTRTHAAGRSRLHAGPMNQAQWKPADYRRRTERVGTVVVALAGAAMAAVAVLAVLMFLLFVWA